MGHTELYLFNMDTDQRITVDLSKDPMWPGGGALHTIMTPDGSKAYLSVMSSDKDPATFLALRINKLDWKTGHSGREDHKGHASGRARWETFVSDSD